MILVDGYADFGTERESLGTHVFEKYHLPVIGIAKNRYNGCILEDTAVYRANSTKPLYVTSKGIDREKAREIVRNMAGEHRIPYLVKAADKYARDWNC